MEVHPTAADIAVMIETQNPLARPAFLQTTQFATANMILDVHKEMMHRGWSAGAARELIRQAIKE